jgi:hypothetical protein
MPGVRMVRRGQVRIRLTVLGVVMLTGHKLMAGGFMMLLAFEVCETVLCGFAGGTDAAAEVALFGMRMTKSHNKRKNKYGRQTLKNC